MSAQGIRDERLCTNLNKHREASEGATWEWFQTLTLTIWFDVQAVDGEAIKVFYASVTIKHQKKALYH